MRVGSQNLELKNNFITVKYLGWFSCKLPKNLSNDLVTTMYWEPGGRNRTSISNRINRINPSQSTDWIRLIRSIKEQSKWEKCEFDWIRLDSMIIRSTSIVIRSTSIDIQSASIELLSFFSLPQKGQLSPNGEAAHQWMTTIPLRWEIGPHLYNFGVGGRNSFSVSGRRPDLTHEELV